MYRAGHSAKLMFKQRFRSYLWFFTEVIAAWFWCTPMMVHAADIYAVETNYQQYKFSAVFIVGPIVVGDDETFRKLMISLIKKGLPPYRINVFSNGGAVYPAMGIGRQIKLLMVPVQAPIRPLNEPGKQTCLVDPHLQDGSTGPTAVWTYYYRENRGDSRCRCDSACFLIWAGGGKREGEGVYIHRPRFDSKEYGNLNFEQARERYTHMQGDVVSYLRDLEVPETIISRMFSVDSQNISNLTETEYRQMLFRPYADELVIARCGPKPSGGNEHFRWAWENESRNPRAAQYMAKVRNWNGCEHEFWRAIFLEQAPQYLKEYDR
jgi:hypothetical protein